MEIKTQKNKGMITTLVLVFGGIFVLLMSGLLGFIMIQHRASLARASWNNALHVAEAGIEYYKWHLSHFPSDFKDGEQGQGPYEHLYQDATGKVQGTFSLSIQDTGQCSHSAGAVITSSGWDNKFPNVKRVIKTTYAAPSVADYSFLINEDVWVGSDVEIRGPYRSNGGIRMDGTNRSSVSSARSTWSCTDSFGCSPTQTKSGVFTSANGNASLFSFPVPSFDFAGISMDLGILKHLTQPVAQGGQGQGLYFAPTSLGYGYHAVFSGTSVAVYTVTSIVQKMAYNEAQGWFWENSSIGSQVLLGTYVVPQGCGAVFFEDNVWVEGTIQGKITVVVADLVTQGKDATIWIAGNVQYHNYTSSDGLLLLAEKDVLIPLTSPSTLRIDGVVVAQTGKFGRNHYDCSWYSADCLKTQLNMLGSVISAKRVGTQWTYSYGGIASGYQNRENVYDPLQTLIPPPFLPTTSPVFELKGWEEVE